VLGLLLATALAGVAGLIITRNVARVTDQALGYNVELEDQADDFRIAVLDVRHFHRNLLFAGPSGQELADFDGAYASLIEEIDLLESLGIRDPHAPQPGEVRQMAEHYNRGFRPAIALYRTDREAFIRASDAGLVELDRMEAAAQELDKLGERLAASAFSGIGEANDRATFVLIAVLVGVAVVGVGLAYVTIRMLRALQELYAAQSDAAERLAKSLREKADFIADVTHELRTPLTVLRGNAEVGLAMNDGGPHAEILSEIVGESARMSRLIEDLLLLARSDAQLRLDLRPVAVEPWIADVAAHAEVLARQRGASFDATLEAEGEVRVDPDRLEQAVLGLVDNAAKYSPAGETLTLGSLTRNGKLVIEIADRGSGIPEEEIPLIFERFYRADRSRSRPEGGTGLGLAIAGTIVEAHGGRIDVASRVGEGTSMFIRLPLAS
jgi:two-component system, OmpR family, sensor histidine kinase VicK